MSTSKKKKAAEEILQQKYYQTLDLINAMRNPPKDKRKITINSKNTTLMQEGGLLAEEDPFDRRNDDELAHGDINAQINVMKYEVNETDFLKEKFGVSSGTL